MKKDLSPGRNGGLRKSWRLDREFTDPDHFAHQKTALKVYLKLKQLFIALDHAA